jgi:hypothetical protein
MKRYLFTSALHSLSVVMSAGMMSCIHAGEASANPQGARFDPVQRGQVSIKHHSLAADDIHLGGNAFDGNATLRFGHLRTVSTSQRYVNNPLWGNLGRIYGYPCLSSAIF